MVQELRRDRRREYPIVRVSPAALEIGHRLSPHDPASVIVRALAIDLESRAESALVRLRCQSYRCPELAIALGSEIAPVSGIVRESQNAQRRSPLIRIDLGLPTAQVVLAMEVDPPSTLAIEQLSAT